MTLQLYHYLELEEKSSKNLKVWKIWHIVVYVLISICGLLNYISLHNAMLYVDEHCVLYPKQLEFYSVNVTTDAGKIYDNREYENMLSTRTVNAQNYAGKIDKENAQNNTEVDDNSVVTEDVSKRSKRELVSRNITDDYEITVEVSNTTVVTGNRTQRVRLDTVHTFFRDDVSCQFAEYMPILSSIFALIWVSLFTMCPGGGRPRSGLRQPWRILAPALVFAGVMVVITGCCFTFTNGGLQDFCANFHNYTNSTTCSSVNEFLEGGSGWRFSGAAAAARAGSAGVWAGWACAGALLLARCITAPDFHVRSTQLHLTNDPMQRAPSSQSRRSRRSERPLSQSTQDDSSVRSAPTLSSQVISASVEHGPPSAPVTPV